jgi:ssDNA-specific exonuclease RecJ
MAKDILAEKTQELIENAKKMPERSPEDMFIENAKESERGFIPGAPNREDAIFLQNSINQFNGIMAERRGLPLAKPLKVDGEVGPKTKEAFKKAYSSIPRTVRRSLAAKMKKMNLG